MKFVHYLEKINGAGLYGMAALVLFGLFFTVITVWALRADKQMIDEAKNVPLGN